MTTACLVQSQGNQQLSLAQHLSYHVNGDWNNVNPTYTTYKLHEFDQAFANYMWFHIFCAFWTVQFIIYWAYAVVAGVFAEWYFSEWESEDEKKLDGNLLTRSMYRVTRYHMGTVAFGALIIAIVRFIRAILLYIETKAMKYENGFVRCILCCVHCILKCLDCCLNKLSKDAFVFTSIFGTPFCSSAIDAFNMIMKNLVNVAALGLVSDYIEIIGK